MSLTFNNITCSDRRTNSINILKIDHKIKLMCTIDKYSVGRNNCCLNYISQKILNLERVVLHPWCTKNPVTWILMDLAMTQAPQCYCSKIRNCIVTNGYRIYLSLISTT